MTGVLGIKSGFGSVLSGSMLVLPILDCPLFKMADQKPSKKAKLYISAKTHIGSFLAP